MKFIYKFLYKIDMLPVFSVDGDILIQLHVRIFNSQKYVYIKQINISPHRWYIQCDSPVLLNRHTKFNLF